MRTSKALILSHPWRQTASCLCRANYSLLTALDAVLGFLRQKAADPSGAVSARATLAKNRVRLRHALRRAPYWADGHIALGHVELALYELALERPDPRLLAAVQVSVDAVRELLKSVCGSAAPGRALLEADYLNGCVLFYQRKYDDALRKFEICLEPANAQILPEKIWDGCLEYAASSALILEKESLAHDYLLRLPPSRRSKKVSAMIEALKLKTAL